ncbi:2-C-methyl-D-erythritol 4-phosphate cytidylyltransferase [Anaerostipes faecalis]|uniref:2-C-methyl-D-erythritol 4-phosphate cytidylyltransferase n=1 Tax=Anaerostipes faecalis TaxID=2738446 RepID=UPI003F0A1382
MKDKVVAIVLAAGEGKRMGSGIPKQYMLIKSRPLVYYALKAFEESMVDEVILVTGADEIDYCKKYIIDKYHFDKVSKVVAGGCERYASVYQGLKAVEDADYVLIHDGARPMINTDLIEKCVYYVRKYRACVVGMPSKDTIKVVNDEKYAVHTPDRKTLWQVQTPQCFEFALVKDAYETLMNSGDTSATDDAMVVETYGNIAVRLFEGGYDNIKITTPEDVRIAGSLMKARKVLRALHKVHDKIIYIQMQAYKQQKKIKNKKIVE